MIMEHFMVRQLHTPPLRPTRLARTPGRECTVNYVTDATLTLDEEVQGVHTLLIDYSRAFNSMDPTLLINYSLFCSRKQDKLHTPDCCKYLLKMERQKKLNQQN